MFKYLNLKIVFRDEYEELKAEWEQQNETIDKLTAEKNKKNRLINALEEDKRDLLDIIAKLEADLEEIKEKKRNGRKNSTK